jgi:hypothetical protein
MTRLDGGGHGQPSSRLVHRSILRPDHRQLLQRRSLGFAQLPCKLCVSQTDPLHCGVFALLTGALLGQPASLRQLQQPLRQRHVGHRSRARKWRFKITGRAQLQVHEEKIKHTLDRRVPCSRSNSRGNSTNGRLSLETFGCSAMGGSSSKAHDFAVDTKALCSPDEDPADKKVCLCSALGLSPQARS